MNTYVYSENKFKQIFEKLCTKVFNIIYNTFILNIKNFRINGEGYLELSLFQDESLEN